MPSGARKRMKMYTKKELNHGGVIFTKNSRSGLYAWGDLWAMSDEEVKEEIIKLCKCSIDCNLVADFANLNNLSMTFDFPRSDALRALLGALKTGVITITKK